jgi:POT family proton-dependent oligopeptide transporter
MEKSIFNTEISENEELFPKGLYFLVGLKVWEVFSYYGMRAFLVFYLIAIYAMDDRQASMLFGSYSALVLGSGIVGGFVADRYLQRFESIMFGACMVMAGHVTLALEAALKELGYWDTATAFQVFCLGLALIAVGTGFLKPNVLTMIGSLFKVGNPKRESGYYAYYMGVNVGALAAPLVGGYLAYNYGWQWGFGAAAVGMAIGLLVLLLGKQYLPQDTQEGAPRTKRARLSVYVLTAPAVVLVAYFVQHGLALSLVLACSFAAGIGYMVLDARRRSDAEDLQSIGRLVALLSIPIVFVAMFEQFPLSINLFTARFVDVSAFGVTIAPTQLLALNSFFVLALLPLAGVLWARLRARNLEPSLFAKFACGFTLMALGFMTLTLCLVAYGSAKIPIGVMVVVYFLITVGEVMISPLSFAAVALMTSKRFEGVSMGMLLLAFAIGNWVAGYYASWATIPDGSRMAEAQGIYGKFFAVTAAICLGAAVYALLLRSWLAKGSRKKAEDRLAAKASA